MLANTEAEVAGLGEVALAKLVLLDLEATLENLLGLGATDGDVDGDLLVTTDTEGTDGVAGLAVDGSLTAELLQHLGGTGQSVTRLADRDVQHELLDAQLAHGVCALVLSVRLHGPLDCALRLRGVAVVVTYHGDWCGVDVVVDERWRESAKCTKAVCVGCCHGTSVTGSRKREGCEKLGAYLMPTNVLSHDSMD